MNAREPMPRPRTKAGQRMYLNLKNRDAVEQSVLVSLQETGPDLVVNFLDAPTCTEFEIGIDLFAQVSGHLLTGLRYKGLLRAI